MKKPLSNQPMPSAAEIEPWAQPDVAWSDLIARGEGEAPPGGFALSLVGRARDRFYPGVQKFRAGSPKEIRWSKESYSIISLAKIEAETMALLSAQDDLISIEDTSPEVVSHNKEHKGHFVIGSRIDNGEHHYYFALVSSDWGEACPGLWSSPFDELKDAVAEAEFVLENWISAMNNFADCMIPPCNDGISV